MQRLCGGYANQSREAIAIVAEPSAEAANQEHDENMAASPTGPYILVNGYNHGRVLHWVSWFALRFDGLEATRDGTPMRGLIVSSLADADGEGSKARLRLRGP